MSIRKPHRNCLALVKFLKSLNACESGLEFIHNNNFTVSKLTRMSEMKFEQTIPRSFIWWFTNTIERLAYFNCYYEHCLKGRLMCSLAACRFYLCQLRSKIEGKS